MFRRCIFWMLALGALGSSAVDADVFFSQSYTGEDLFNDPSVSFPTRMPEISGTSLFFGPGAVNFEKLFAIPLVTAGVLDASHPVTATVAVNLTRLQSDHDSELAIGDGSILIGFQPADNSSGSGFAVAFDDLGNQAGLTEGFEFFSGAGFPSIGSSFDVFAEITVDSGTTNVSGSFLSGSGNADLVSTTLNLSSALTFAFLANHFHEEYQINSLSLTLQGTPIPEPAGSVILLVPGVVVLCGRHMRRTH